MSYIRFVGTVNICVLNSFFGHFYWYWNYIMSTKVKYYCDINFSCIIQPYIGNRFSVRLADICSRSGVSSVVYIWTKLPILKFRSLLYTHKHTSQGNNVRKYISGTSILSPHTSLLPEQGGGSDGHRRVWCWGGGQIWGAGSVWNETDRSLNPAAFCCPSSLLGVAVAPQSAFSWSVRFLGFTTTVQL